MGDFGDRAEFGAGRRRDRRRDGQTTGGLDRAADADARHARTAERAAAAAQQPADAGRRDRAASRSSTRTASTTTFDRIVQDNSSYYVLAYYPPNPKRDGKFHNIQVRVNRPGVTVRARRGYANPSGKVKEPVANPASKLTARGARGARQSAAGERPDHPGVRGAVQRHGAEGLGAARRGDARPRSAARRRRQAAALVLRGGREGQVPGRQQRHRDAEPPSRDQGDDSADGDAHVEPVRAPAGALSAPRRRQRSVDQVGGIGPLRPRRARFHQGPDCDERRGAHVGRIVTRADGSARRRAQTGAAGGADGKPDLPGRRRALRCSPKSTTTPAARRTRSTSRRR